MIQSIALNLFRNTMIVVGILAIGYIGMCSEKTIADPRPVVKASPAYLMQFCEKTLEGEFPGSVMIQNIGGGTYLSTDTRDIGKALDVAFGSKKWHGKRVVTFCR